MSQGPIYRVRGQEIDVDAAVAAFPDPVFILDRQGRYLDVFGGTERSLYDDPTYLLGKTLHDVLPGDVADHYLEMIHRTLDTETIQVVEYSLSAEDVKRSPKDGPSGRQWFQGRISPFRVGDEVSDHVLWVAINISEKKQAELERDQAMAALEKALVEIRNLRGILPICSSCKKIRDEDGGWHALENYISAHSEADFSHGICPDCMKALYPEYSPDEG
ncbi:PAS domain-containing protein [Desulfoluna sp.]|uniref:PAS domain-containing protein n=1 Tax=Desulfoluna sp. TaxID=2045199 RepID=UPI0026087979|nr:PAS domain-containing protein [Desulfoluna sp.]